MPKTTKKKVLIIEDEKPLARTLKLKFEKSGYLVKVITNGFEALADVKKGKYDLVLLDLMLPQVNGFEILQGFEIKKIKIPVFVMSNLGQPEDIKKAKKLGAKKYFVKTNISTGSCQGSSRIFKQIKNKK